MNEGLRGEPEDDASGVEWDKRKIQRLMKRLMVLGIDMLVSPSFMVLELDLCFGSRYWYWHCRWTIRLLVCLLVSYLIPPIVNLLPVSQYESFFQPSRHVFGSELSYCQFSLSS